MFIIMYSQKEERIFEDMDQVTTYLLQGWKLYGYTNAEKQADFLLKECRNC